MNMNTQKQALLTRRAELTNHMMKVEALLDDTPTKDLEDFSTERQDDEVLEALGHVELAEVRRIDAALARIEAGTYGLCLDCGEPIAEARLIAVPDAALCRNCAA